LPGEEVHAGQLEWMKDLKPVLNTDDQDGATCIEELRGWIFPAAECGNELM